MELICYLLPGTQPNIRPAEATREWMDATQQSYAYRCLPLSIANAHGWEILSPVAFDAVWNGGPRREDVVLDVPPGTPANDAPLSFFGEGVVTFHINGLFRTAPGWNLWVGGSPNRPKDGIHPLTGVIETDWSPYSFTMNWRFTRRNHRVHFDAGEPICFMFPVQRAVLEAVTPRFAPIESEPQLAAHHAAWTQSRLEFNRMLRDVHERLPTAQAWQRRYFRGLDMTGQMVVPDHLSKLRTAPFAPSEPDAPSQPDLNTPLNLQTDTATLGTVIGALAGAREEWTNMPEATRMRLVRQLATLGLGESEAAEVLWAALGQAGR
jgi:hypothetical protein